MKNKRSILCVVFIINVFFSFYSFSMDLPEQENPFELLPKPLVGTILDYAVWNQDGNLGESKNFLINKKIFFLYLERLIKNKKSCEKMTYSKKAHVLDLMVFFDLLDRKNYKDIKSIYSSNSYYLSVVKNIVECGWREIVMIPSIVYSGARFFYGLMSPFDRFFYIVIGGVGVVVLSFAEVAMLFEGFPAPMTKCILDFQHETFEQSKRKALIKLVKKSDFTWPDFKNNSLK